MGRSPVCEERHRARRGRRWPPTEQECSRDTVRRGDHGSAALARAELERGERPACHAGRGDRRAATGLRRTTNEAFPARYPAGVRSAQRWRKAEALSPRAIRARAPSVLRAVVGAHEYEAHERTKPLSVCLASFGNISCRRNWRGICVYSDSHQRSVVINALVFFDDLNNAANIHKRQLVG